MSIKGVHFDPYQVKVFAVRRGTLAGGLPVWWDEKLTHWKRTPAQMEAQEMTLPKPGGTVGEAVIPLEKWRFQTDPDHGIAKGAWTAVSFDDSTWNVREAGPWNFFDSALKDYHGTGLYRIKFTVPPEWKDQRILLCLYDFDLPIVYDMGNFFINGTKVASYKAHGWSQTYNYDVTAQVHPGENELALEAIGGPKLGGLGGSVWIESRAPFTSSIDLTGTWQAVKSDWLTKVDAPVPGTSRAKYLTREVEIPADWKGRTVFVDWETKSQWVGCVVINGKPLCYNAFAHPFGLITRLNVTQYLKPGETNRIEIWPYHTMTVQSNDADNGEVNGLQLDSVWIGWSGK